MLGEQPPGLVAAGQVRREVGILVVPETPEEDDPLDAAPGRCPSEVRGGGPVPFLELRRLPPSNGSGSRRS